MGSHPLRFPKKILDFNVKEGCKLNEPVFDQITLTNSSMKKNKIHMGMDCNSRL